MNKLIEPHGGTLKELYLSADAAAAEKQQAREYPSWDLTYRQLCDVELLLNGAFSPLEGFLSQADYRCVLSDLHLENGVLWPMPVTLDVTETFADGIAPGSRVALRDPEGVLLAVLEVTDLWRPDKTVEALQVFGTDELLHPNVKKKSTAKPSLKVMRRLEQIEKLPENKQSFILSALDSMLRGAVAR